MSCKLEPAIWSRGTGQRIACFDRCQLIIAGMSNIKEVNRKLRLYVSFLEYGRHVAQLRRRRRRRRRANAPTSNTASQDSHEKINSWVSFIFPLHDEYGAPLGGPKPPELRYYSGEEGFVVGVQFIEGLFRGRKMLDIAGL